jgi:hypothetical protein
LLGQQADHLARLQRNQQPIQTNMSQFSFEPFRGGDALSEYVDLYRRTDLPVFEVGAPLDLYPLRPAVVAVKPQLTWEHPWPFGDRAGVYMLYDEAIELFYIGKASMNRCLGQRLYEYFGSGDICVPKME